MPDIQADLFQFFCHPWPTVAAQTEARQFFDMRQRHHIRSLPAAGWSAAERPQTTRADAHHIAHLTNGKRRSVLLGELKPHGFWLAKNTVAFLRNSTFLWHGRQGVTQCPGAPLEVGQHSLPMSFIVGSRPLILICHAMANGVVEQNSNLARRRRDCLLLANA